MDIHNQPQQTKKNTDIRNRDDIYLLISSFYKQVMADPLIGFFFTHVQPIELDEHIQTLCDFWEFQLLGQRNYRGNTFLKHKLLNDKAALSEHHFQRWLLLFTGTLDSLFTGDTAEMAKRRATMIAEKMSLTLAAHSAEARKNKTPEGLAYYCP
jgi:hemoglobin